jgi:hypothetical protein
MRPIIIQADTEKNTPTSDQIIHFFALFTFSSSPHDMRYMIPLTIRARTASTAVYLIIIATIKDRSVSALFDVRFASSVPPHSSLHQGSPAQTIHGGAEYDISVVVNKLSAIKIPRRIFFISIV